MATQKTYIPRKGQDAEFANVDVSGDVAITGSLAVAGGVSGGVTNVTDATVSVTAASHAGKTIVFSRAAGVTATLPAATGTGNIYRFVIGTTATSNANVIKVANATDVMNGSLNIQQDTDSDGTVKVWRADAGDDTMTFAGAATTGGIVGGYIQCLDYKTGFWSCQAFTQSGGGSEATPFSATVS